MTLKSTQATNMKSVTLLFSPNLFTYCNVFSVNLQYEDTGNSKFIGTLRSWLNPASCFIVTNTCEITYIM